jgi:hypothetical protein
VQGALSPFPDWKSDVLTDSSRQAWLEKIPSSANAAYPIDQPEEGKSIKFEALFDDADGTEGERFSTNYHRGRVAVLFRMTP